MRFMLSLAAVAALMAAPYSAIAVTSTTTVHYTTSYQQTFPMASGGQYTGRMTLTFRKDGTVSGTYRDEFAGGLHSLAGGVSGNHIWLSFGMRGRRQFNGTIGKGGIITGTLSNWRGPKTYNFKAVPTTS
jgi:hypothetical protein